MELPPPSYSPVVFALLTGMVTLIGFALPPILALRRVPALRVIKRDLGSVDSSRVVSYLLGVTALALIMVMQAGEFKLGIYMVVGVLTAIAILALFALALLYVIRFFKANYHQAWLFGLRNLVRRPMSSVIQIIAFGLGIMALLVLTVIRGDLLDEWQASIPDDAPSRFIINIHPAQVNAMEAFFDKNNIKTPHFYPMIRGRLVTINGVSVDKENFESQQAKQMLSREFNLSWAEVMDADNKILQGKWWTKAELSDALISIEKSVATNLNIELFDKLKFKVGDQFFEASVTSVREVDWGSLKANFYVIGTPGLLKDFPTTYMAPFYLSTKQFTFLNDLVAQFNNVTVIDVAAIMMHVREIIQRVTLAVEYVFLFTLLSGVMVLFAGIQATHDERMVENAIIRTLGGRKKQLLQSLWAEYLCLGGLAGVVAALLATVISLVLSHYVLKMPLHWNYSVWLYGFFGGAIGVGLFGVVGSLQVIKQPPLVTLKKVVISN